MLPLALSALTTLILACGVLPNALNTPPPTLAPTVAPPPLDLPDAADGEPSFSEASAYETAMRPGFEADLEPFLDGTRYWLDVDIKTGPVTVVGQETVLYVNASGDTLNEVVFHLYPNLIGTGPVVQVENLRVDGQPVEPLFSRNRGTLEVPLPAPLPPGERAEIGMAFGLSLPSETTIDNYGRLGDFDGVLSLPSFYPLLSVYDPETGEWWREDPDPDGDPVFSESALFEVQLTVPGEAVVVTVGQTLDRTDNADGTTDYHIVTGPVRDFAIHMSEDYEVDSATANGVTVNVYSRPGDDETDLFVLEQNQTALAVFDENFGAYPYAELDIVQTGTLASGIEFPGVYVLSDDVWDEDDSFLPVVLSHEAAHMWWYGVVGNDQVGQPWLDEGLAQYAVEVYLREAVSEGAAQGTHAFYEQTVEEFVEEDGEDRPVGLPISAYSSPGYRTFVYFKAPLFFDLLEETYGPEAMTDFLHAYYETHKYGVATTQSLHAVAEEVFAEDLDPLFEEWVGEED